MSARRLARSEQHSFRSGGLVFSLRCHERICSPRRAAVRLQEEQTAILEQQKEEARRKSEQNRSVLVVVPSAVFRLRCVHEGNDVRGESFCCSMLKTSDSSSGHCKSQNVVLVGNMKTRHSVSAVVISRSNMSHCLPSLGT